MKYIVNVREVHIQPYEVEAISPEDAAQAVADGEGDLIEGGFEYSHTLDRSLWDMTDENGDLHNID